MPKMDSEVKEKWLNALESGEYKQTRNCLKDDNGFCCLGVLSDLYLKTTIGGHSEWKRGYSMLNNDMLMPDYDDHDLPPYVMDWAGLDIPNPKVIAETKGLGEELTFADNYHLSELNDDLELSFTEIAALIREQL